MKGLRLSVFVLWHLVLSLCVMLNSCGSGSGRHAGEEVGDTLTVASELLTLVDCGGYMIADVKNPWDTTRLMARYVLVPRDAREVPQVDGAAVVRVPVESSLVYSGVHAGVIDELGKVSAVTSVADGSYFRTPAIVKGLADGSIVDVGSSMSPSLEKIVEHNPEVILASPYENAGHGVIDQAGITVIDCADYMESTPIARAEWIKFLGALYGDMPRADSIFNSVCHDYEALTALVGDVKTRPEVITEQCFDGVWAMPGGRSYMARMLQDAGAVYPWASDGSAGSFQLDYAAVLDCAVHADCWLIRSYGPMDKGALKANNPLNASFDAFKDGNVWVCDTSVSPLFDEFPFHPERLLKDYIIIFHPGLLPGEPRYYRRMSI